MNAETARTHLRRTLRLVLHILSAAEVAAIVTEEVEQAAP